MDRKLISRRIGSILDDISRLSNALYAMDTTDIQRYPDNYEILSTDAALRAERIACRLRHLIYSSTSIQKGEYLQSASVAQGISIAYENGVLEVTLPEAPATAKFRVPVRPALFRSGAVRKGTASPPLPELCCLLCPSLRSNTSHQAGA